ncbi:unnamed protein product [Lathyrus sativus]|nr:unnamed protein product [Lathyrus sativus]
MALHRSTQKLEWRTLFYGNVARPKAIVNMWLACRERLATRTRLHKFCLIDTTKCYFCNEDETQKLLLFECKEMKVIWERVLDWIQIRNHLFRWSQKIKWII